MHILPRDSLQAEDNLWTITKENRISRKSVNVIYRGKNQIYITSGINLGERIVTGSFSNLVDGLFVEPKARQTSGQQQELVTPAIVEAL